MGKIANNTENTKIHRKHGGEIYKVLREFRETAVSPVLPVTNGFKAFL